MATINITSFQFNNPFGLQSGQKYQVVDQAGKPDYIYQGNGNWIRTRDEDLVEPVFVQDNRVPLYVNLSSDQRTINSTGGEVFIDTGPGASPVPVAMRNTYKGQSYLLKHRATTGSEAASWWAHVPVGRGYYNVFGLGTWGIAGCIHNMGRMCLGLIGTNVFANAGGVVTVGTWTQSAVDTAPGGNYFYSTIAGDSKTFSVTGHTLVVRTMLNVNLGYAVIAIDGDYTAATKLPTFSQADADAGLCRAIDVGRRYINGYASGTAADYHITLAEGLSDAPHTVTFEATGTKPVASSATRAAIGAVVGCSATDASATPVAGSKVIVRIEDVQHFYFGGSSAMCWVPEFEKTVATGTYEFLSEMHGGSTLVSATITADGVDQSGLAVDTYIGAVALKLRYVSTVASTDATGTPIAQKTVDHIFSSYQDLPSTISILWNILVAKRIKNNFPLMMALGNLKPGSSAPSKGRWDSVTFGSYTSSGADLTTGANAQRGNVKAMTTIASIQGTSRKAICALLDGGVSVDYFSKAAPDYVYCHDRPDYLKMYFARSSGAVREEVAVGDTLRAVIGFGINP